MKNTKRMIALLLTALMLLSLAGCGAQSMPTDSVGNRYDASMEMGDYEAPFYGAPMEKGDSAYGETLASDSAGAEPEMNRKWIVTVNMDAETEDLDTLLAQLGEKIRELKGYVEDQRIHNGSIYSDRRYRYADLTIRIPAGDVDAFTQKIEGISNVICPSVISFYQNSLQYEDYQVRAVEKVQIRMTDKDVGVVYPDIPTGNTYCITGNYLLTGKNTQNLLPVAQTLYEQLKEMTYTPCKLTVPVGCYVEPGKILYVTDRNGKLLLCSDSPLGCSHQGLYLSPEYMRQILSAESVFDQGTIDNLYEDVRYVVAVPVLDPVSKIPVGAVIVSTRVQETLTVLTWLSNRYFMISVLVIIIAVFKNFFPHPLDDFTDTITNNVFVINFCHIT